MVPLYSVKISRVPTYSKIIVIFTHTGLSPTLVWLSRHFCLLHNYHWADPRSLATTSGISVDFFSSGYWDVSLLRVSLIFLWIRKYYTFIQTSLKHTEMCLNRYLKGGFPHSDIRGSKSVDLSPRLFAACHVLHRLQSPRHSPDALQNAWIHITRRDKSTANCFLNLEQENKTIINFVRAFWLPEHWEFSVLSDIGDHII